MAGRRGQAAAPAGRARQAVAGLADEQIVSNVLRGRGEDFEELVRRHQGAIHSFLLRMVRDPDEAMDLSQEVFLKVFCSLERFDPRFRFTTWMYRIASNAAIDQIRKRRSAPVCSLDAPADDGSTGREVAGVDPTPDQFLQARETRGRLEDAIQTLPPEYRQVLLLRHQGERRYDEIARITGLPIGTVKNRIFRAREILKRSLPS
ncbi:MAG TPA: sigma-70 family RNA polymerase sigma factor [Candidatus Polarisedimenticolia bacterium]|nr:sigma-70 family RNA polymerase sigma factor [Candidatus Polarisedimenticolia bacterium]